MPYLTFDRVVDHAIRSEWGKNQSKKATNPKTVKKADSSKTLTPSHRFYKPVPKRVCLATVVKLEAPEVFVESKSCYQYVSRPEFSDDDSSLVITISSDSD